MRKLLVIIILLCAKYCLAQQRELDAFKSAFIKQNGFPEKELNSYYLGIIEHTLHSTKSKEKYGFLHRDGKIFKSAEFDFASDFIGGKSNIRKDSIPGLLFSDGSVKYFTGYTNTYFTSGDIGMAQMAGKYGFIDKQGNIILPIEYDDALPFFKGYASVKKGNKWYYIDEAGRRLFPESYLLGYQPISGNYAVVYDNIVRTPNRINPLLSATFEYTKKVATPLFHQSLYDLKSKSLQEFPEYDAIAGFYMENYMIVIKNGKHGVIDRSSKLIIPTEYEEIREIRDKMVIAKKGKWGMVDLENKTIIPFEYDRLGMFEDGLAYVSKGNNSYYVDRNDRPVLFDFDLEFNWFGNFQNGIAVAKKNGKVGYIDRKGKTLIPFIYDEGLPFSDDRALVYLKDRNECFFIDSKGNRIFKESYPYLWQETGGFVRYAK